MHAGVLYMLGEVLGGVFVIHRYADRGWVPVATKASVEYVKKVRGTAWAETTVSEETFKRVEAEVSEKGRSAFTTDTKVLTDEGDIAAIMKVEYLVKG